MKRLIYHNGKYYLSDDLKNKNGKTMILDYIVSKSNMPHKYFKDEIVIYGRSSCPYCIKTIELLKNLENVIFVEIDSEPHNLFDKVKLLDILHNEIGNHKTVPIVFDKGKFIGGASDSEKHWSSNK